MGSRLIYVSNHGGRQLDHAAATIETLREVVDAVAGRAEIVVDGGFMRGTDILKAIALGASAVGIGRLQAYALAAGGEAVLVRLLELLEEEIRGAMALLGRRVAGRAGRALRPSFRMMVRSESGRASHFQRRSTSVRTATTRSRSAARTRAPRVATSSPGSTGTSVAATIGPTS